MQLVLPSCFFEEFVVSGEEGATVVFGLVSFPGSKSLIELQLETRPWILRNLRSRWRLHHRTAVAVAEYINIDGVATGVGPTVDGHHP